MYFYITLVTYIFMAYASNYIDDSFGVRAVLKIKDRTVVQGLLQVSKRKSIRFSSPKRDILCELDFDVLAVAFHYLVS